MKKRIGIVGGGIVGLATAYQVRKIHPNINIVLFEKENEVGKHQTSRNSGVIHSGIYYKPGTLKAENCIRGYNLLLEFCRENDVKFDLCGKIIVATHARELSQLDILLDRGLKNRLSGIKKISASQIKEYEPHAAGLAGIHVPQTGIINYLDVAKKLADNIRVSGSEIRLSTEVVDLKNTETSVEVITAKRTDSFDLVVNCAGLYSDRLALKTDPSLNVRILPFRGEYYQIKAHRSDLVKNLIYPVPNPQFPFLGVHFTRMMGGGVEVGPNAVLALAREGYSWSKVNARDLADTFSWPGFYKIARKHWKDGAYEMSRSFSKHLFWKSATKLIPNLKIDDIERGFTGVRAQACDRKGNLLDDFEIRHHGRLIQVLNAPSPAATSSLSIGLTIRDAISKLI